MSNTVNIQPPSLMQDPDQQIVAIQAALQTLQSGVNQNATDPAISLYVPSTTITAQQSTTSATPVQIPGLLWTVNAQGGVIHIDAVLNGTVSDVTKLGLISLMIDNVPVLTVPTPNTGASGGTSFSAAFVWRQQLSSGPHQVGFKFQVAGGATISLNAASSTSVASIEEFPLT